jgi:hypothetical protein
MLASVTHVNAEIPFSLPKIETPRCKAVVEGSSSSCIEEGRRGRVKMPRNSGIISSIPNDIRCRVVVSAHSLPSAVHAGGSASTRLEGP